MDRTQKLRKLVKLIVEQQMKQLSEDFQEAPKMSRNEFLGAVKNYGAHKSQIYRSNDLRKTVAEIKKLVESAEEITLTESDGWFDKITVNRHMKQMKEAYKVLEKTCNEIVQSQQRFESAYNDIGRVLENYYDV